MKNCTCLHVVLYANNGDHTTGYYIICDLTLSFMTQTPTTVQNGAIVVDTRQIVIGQHSFKYILSKVYQFNKFLQHVTAAHNME